MSRDNAINDLASLNFIVVKKYVMKKEENYERTFYKNQSIRRFYDHES